MPSSVRKALDGLPMSLDETYERMLQEIPKEKSEHAIRLFQCMVAAVRPLRVEELAELFAIKFGADSSLNLDADWRPENPEEEVLSTCSTFITTIDDQDSKIVQFSHSSVEECLTSDRLQLSNVENIRQYYISLEPAHAILARVCMTVLLQVVKKQNESDFGALPLGSYATEHWVRHARFRNVASRIEDSLAHLFDPGMPYFKPQILLRCMKGMGDVYPVQPMFLFDEPDRVTPLFLAAFCGFSGLVKRLIMTHAPDVNTECWDGLSPLHGATDNGQVGSARVLLENGAHVNAKGSNGCTPLHHASYYGHLELAQLLLERGANLHARTIKKDTPLCFASRQGYLEIVRLLLDHGADVNVRGADSLTPYQISTDSKNGHRDIAQLLLERGANKGCSRRFHYLLFLIFCAFLCFLEKTLEKA